MPRPPDDGGPPPFGPVGAWNRDHPPHFIDVKPLLMKTP